MRIAYLRACLSAVSIILTVGCVTPIQQAQWVVVETPNFEIASTMSSEDAAALATDLERFRSLVYAITTAPKVESPVPTKIVAFSRRSEFAPFRPAGAAGFFTAGLRANNVALTDWSGKLGATEIIFHEYVHFILRNGTSTHYPMWYDEGFAEVMSTVTPHEGRLVVGALPKARLDWFRFGDWLSFSRILKVTEYSQLTGQELGMFYAQAWALSHYVALDLGGSAHSMLSQYIELLESGSEPTEAYESAFGEGIGRSGLKIRKKLERGDWRLVGVPIDKLDYDRTPPRLRTPSEAEIATRLGQLQLSSRKGVEAQVLFEAALALDPMSPRAQAGMGDALKFQEKFEQAEAYFRRAVELDPSDPLNLLDLAEYLHEAAREQARGKSRTQLLDEARQVYRKSADLDRDLPETLLMYGRTFLEPGEDATKAIAPIRRAYRRIPSHKDIITSLAEAYVATDRELEARLVLRRMAATKDRGSLSTNLDEAIEEIRKTRQKASDELDEREAE